MKFLTTTDKHSHAKGNSRKAIHEKLLKLKTTDNAETDLVHKPSLSIHRGREPAAPLRASSYPHCGGQAKLGPPARLACGYSEFTHRNFFGILQGPERCTTRHSQHMRDTCGTLLFLTFRRTKVVRTFLLLHVHAHEHVVHVLYCAMHVRQEAGSRMHFRLLLGRLRRAARRACACSPCHARIPASRPFSAR